MKKSQQLLHLITAGRRLLVLLFILLGAGAVMAQSPVKGMVKDKDGKPLAGATVTIKGKKVSTTTSPEGNLTIAAGRGDVLVISYVGYQDHELKVFPG
ncbi:MAG TPA: carboxypeptidase-like regulatory domain-containing protein, partial [Chitinophagaceae bacterium]|nr:carboxypeptidase-like regulatory domain-containing protein [Chitinophagaceae bacterium]